MKTAFDRDDVVIPSRRPTGRTILVLPDDENGCLVKTFSTGVAATQVYGGGGSAIFGSTETVVSYNSRREKAALKERRRHLLVTMKASNETEESAGQVIQQEDLQEWLDNLQLRLHQPCHNAPSGSRKERRSTGWPVSKTKSEDETDHLLLQLKGGSSHSHPMRSRSVVGLTENAAAALTDSHYLDDLQNALQKASVSSLHRRLAERKVKDSDSTLRSVRPKTSAATAAPPVPKVATKGALATEANRRSKTSPNTFHSVASCRRGSSHTADIPPGSIQQHLEAKPSLSRQSPRAHSRELASRTSILFFDRAQTANDIYEAAEQLILPPARNEITPTDQDSSNRDSPLIQPLEDVEVEDFWGND